MMKLLSRVLFLLLLATGSAMAQPGPQPSPWSLNGNAISPVTPNLCMTFPSTVTGGCVAPGTINVDALYIAGSPVNTSSLQQGRIWVGNASNVAAPQVPSGDLSMTLSGVFSVTNLSNVINGSLPVTGLADPTMSINGTPCTLGASCTVTATASGITVGTTVIGSGTSNGLLYNNSGLLGNLSTINNGVVVTNGSGVPSVSSTLPAVNGSAVTALNASSITSGTLAYARQQFGPPVSPAKPDTVDAFYALTTTAGSPNITFAGVGGNPAPAFTAADIGKLLYCTGIGPASTEGRLITSITGVTSATQITLAANATQALTLISQRCVFGSDQTANIQAAFDYGAANNIGSFVQGGIYLTSSGLTCLPPPNNNQLQASGPLCNLDAGAIIIAMAPMDSVITYGGMSVFYTEILRSSTFGGGTVDANFVADYAVSIPFQLLSTRKDQTTKNAKLAGARWGNSASPQASAGSLDLNVTHLRDIYYVTVTNITNSATPVVTTQWAHGFATGRIVALSASSGMPEVNQTFFKITVTSPTTFTLDNTDSTSWGTFTGTATVGMTMPSMRLPAFVTAVTNANPGVVTTSKPHGFTNGMSVFLADLPGMNVGGVYTVTVISPTTFSFGVDTTSLGTYTGGAGAAEEWLPVADVEKGIYFDNNTDADIIGANINGVRFGVVGNPANAGFDSKFVKIHIYNYNQQGNIFAGVYMGGDNTFESLQFDLPMRYGVMVTNVGNAVTGTRMNYSGFGILAEYNNYASLIRLEGANAEAQSIGSGIKGSATANALGVVSANGAKFGLVPNYSQFGVETRFVTFTQPDTSGEGIFSVTRHGGGASLTVKGDSGDTRLYVYDRMSGRGGLYFAAGGAPGRTDVNVIDAAENYLSTPVRIEQNLTSFFQPIFYGGVTLANSVTGTGSMVLSASPTFTGTVALPAATLAGNLLMADGQFIYGTSGGGAVSAGFQFNASSNLVSVYAGNASVAAFGAAGIVTAVPITVGGSLYATTHIASGSGALVLSNGSYGITKTTAAGSAPGAPGGRIELVCGTSPGTGKLQITAGTSNTPVVIQDNIGTGVSGC